MILLIHPPSAKPSEPPAGIARLSGMLESHGHEHILIDANIEGLLYILDAETHNERPGDTWARRAFKDRKTNIEKLRSRYLYQNPDRYRRAVKDIDKALKEASPSGITIGLADYKDSNLSPLRSSDLVRASRHPEMNPFFPYFSARLSQLMNDHSPTHIGISLNYLSQALTTFSMAGFLRRNYPDVQIILGGGLVTSWGARLRDIDNFHGLIDEFVIGPGELPLLRLLGINPESSRLIRPSYRQLPIDKYLSPGQILPYSASTGCYWNKCNFCPEKAEGNSYVAIKPQQVVIDLAIVKQETNPVLIHLLDNALSPYLLEHLVENNIKTPWYGFARISSSLADPDFCIQLKKSGCRMLKLGIESGDQGVLDKLEKGISIDLASRVLKNLKSAGIGTYVYLLFGTPPENEASAEKTLAFTVQHSKYIDFLNLAIFNMPVCSANSSGLKTRDFSKSDLSLYTDFVHPLGWDRKKVRAFLDRKFKRHPSIASIIRREPQIFTSNHAPFFV